MPKAPIPILLVRGERVIIDTDLARLYGVETKALNRAVKRNIERFPEEFVFRLTQKEWQDLRCQFGTSKALTLPLPRRSLGEGGFILHSSAPTAQTAHRIQALTTGRAIPSSFAGPCP